MTRPGARGRDALLLLELADGPLDAVEQLVFCGIEGPLARHTCALREDGLGAAAPAPKTP